MKILTSLDWTIVVAFLLSVIVIGDWAAKRASKSAEDFFHSGCSMPWWLLGVSMVACTFSCDTPIVAGGLWWCVSSTKAGIPLPSHDGETPSPHPRVLQVTASNK